MLGAFFELLKTVNDKKRLIRMETQYCLLMNINEKSFSPQSVAELLSLELQSRGFSAQGSVLCLSHIVLVLRSLFL